MINHYFVLPYSETSSEGEERAIGNPTYGENDTVTDLMEGARSLQMNKVTLHSDYSSDGPEYEPVQPSKKRQVQKDSHSNDSSTLPTPYETPVSGVQTPS